MVITEPLTIKIYLYGNKELLLDIDDFPILGEFQKPYVGTNDGRVYLRKKIDKKLVSKTLTKFLIHTEKGLEVDHINGNPLDNRRINLRVCTRAENARNRGPQKKKNNHPYKGIVFHKNRNVNLKWCAKVKTNGVTKSSRYFMTALEAAKEYDKLAKIYHGEFARLNFPDN